MATAVQPGRRSPHTPITVTIGDTRRITGLGSTKVYELIKQGKLKSVAVGRRRLVLYASIEALLHPSAT
jgi:excisionase family DNA binding protein